MAISEKEFLTRLSGRLDRAPLASPPPRLGQGRMKPNPPPNMVTRDAMADWFTRELIRLAGTVDRVAGLEQAGEAVAAFVARTCAAGGQAVVWDEPRALAAKAPLEAAGFTVHVDPSDRAVCAAAVVGVTSAAYAVAETGSIALAAGPGLSRMVSLLPPVHVALVPTSCLMPTVADYFMTVASLRPIPPALNLITGASRTSDIEMELCIGVHGPSTVHVVLYDDGRAASLQDTTLPSTG